MNFYKKTFHLLLAILLFTWSALYSQEELPRQGVCAHRGAGSVQPENTIPAFKEALRLGAHMMEFDVWLSSDGKLVVMHDPYVDRTTNGKGLIADHTLEYIKSLDAGSWKDAQFAGIRTPTFEEVIEIMPGNVWLDIHIKKSKEAAGKVAEIILKTNRMHQAVLAVKKNMVSAIKEVSRDILICNMDRVDSPEQYVDETIAMKFDFIQLTKRADSNLPQLVKKLKENGIKINYYVANSPDKFKSLINAGVDYVLVDESGKILNAAIELGITPADYKLEE